MFDINQILDNYDQAMRGFQAEILREYLLFKILQGIFNEMQSSQLSLMDGTEIRVIYGSDRFSEDIDFDNFGLPWDNFILLMNAVQRFLRFDGFAVEISLKKKGAYHCNVRFSELLS